MDHPRLHCLQKNDVKRFSNLTVKERESEGDSGNARPGGQPV